MELAALTWQRYRAFKEKQRLSLAPVTLIIGKNGSGKSIISRLPVLIANALLETAEGPVDLSAGTIEHAASYQDLVFSRGALPFALGSEFVNGTTIFSFETTLRYVQEKRVIAIEKFVLYRDQDVLLRVEISDADQLLADEPNFNIDLNGTATLGAGWRFRGLLPHGPEALGPDATEAASVLHQLRNAFSPPSYLGPFRAEPSYSHRTPSQTIRDLGSKGERAVELLADDCLRHGGELAESVSAWFAKQLGQAVSVDVSGDYPQVRVTDNGSGFAGALSDTGAGFAQCLPIVVQHFAYRFGRLKSPMLIVEQPELHLHPAAHGALADLIIETASGGNGWKPAVCVVETHSEQFIMRVRRRITEGLSPDKVKLWSLNHVESTEDVQTPEPLRKISFDSRGNPDTWPAGVFEEAFDDLAAMRRNVRERGL